MTKFKLFAGALAGAALWAAEMPKELKFDAEHYLNYVKVLASEKMRGRGTGSKELETAAELIAKEFKASRSSPSPPTPSWAAPTVWRCTSMERKSRWHSTKNSSR